MNRNIDKRLQELEQRIVKDDQGKMKGIFFRTVDCSKRDPPPPGPVLGWAHHDYKIMRLPGESDASLQARAIETVQPFLREDQVPTFFSIQNTMGE